MEYSLSEIATTANRLVLRGRLDSAGAGQLERPLSAAIDSAARSVLADLSAVSFVGSLGIRLLIRVARSLNGRGLALVLFAPQPAVLEVLHLAGLGDLVPIADSEAEALALLAG